MKRLIYILAFLGLFLHTTVHAGSWLIADGTRRSGVTRVDVTPTLVTTDRISGNTQTITFGRDVVAYFSADQLLTENAQFTREFHRDGNATTDHVLCGGESGTTTGWTDAGQAEFAVETSTVNKGSNAFKVVAQGTNNGRAYKDLSDFALTTNYSYILSVDVRHTGSGGDWSLRLGTNNAGNTPRVLNQAITSTDTTYQTYELTFLYNTNTRFLVFIENNGGNDGGVYVDNVRVYEHDPSFNVGFGSVQLSGDTSYRVASSGGTGYGVELHDDGNAASDHAGNESGTTTGWTDNNLSSGNSFYASSTVYNNGSFSLAANSNANPTNNAYFSRDIGTDFGLTEGVYYRLVFYARHHGIGDEWKVRTASTVGLDSNAINHATLTNSDTTFVVYSVEFEYSSNYRYFGAREGSGANDGGVYVDAISIKQIQPDSLLAHTGGNQARVERYANIDGAGIAAGHSNYVTRSWEFDNAAWNKLNSFVTSYGTDPMGTEKAMFLAADGSSGAHSMLETFAVGTFADNTIQTASVYFQASTLSWIRLAYQLRDNTLVGAYFDGDNQAIGTQSGISSAYLSQNSANGFYRASITLMNDSGLSGVSRVIVYLADSDNGWSFQNDGAGVTIFGLQVTEHPSAMPYLSTEGSVAVNTGNSGGIAFDIPIIRVDASGASTTTLFAEDLGNELLTNGNMESGDPPSNWTAYGLATTDAVTDERTGGSGTTSMEVTWGDTVARGARQEFSTIVGESYKVVGWAKKGTVTSAAFYIYNSDDSSNLASTDSTTSGSWEELSCYFVATTTTTRVYAYAVAGNGQTARYDDVSVKHVDSAYNSGPSSSAGLWPNHGTLIAQVRFGGNADIWPTDTDVGIVSTANAYNFLYARAATHGSANVRSYDGGTSATLSLSPVGNIWYTMVVEWGALNSNVSQYRIGYLTSSGISWGSWANFDGAFTEGTQIVLGYGAYGEFHISKLILLRGHLPASFWQMAGY